MRRVPRIQRTPEEIVARCAKEVNRRDGVVVLDIRFAAAAPAAVPPAVTVLTSTDPGVPRPCQGVCDGFLRALGTPTFRTKAAIRRKRYVELAVEKNKTDQELTSPRDLDGELLDAHLVPLAGRRNPRGRDGRRL